jgi:AcrR family transcriptional regulator
MTTDVNDPSGSPSGSGWDRRREQLLGEYERVALELFAARSFKAVTVDEIAEAAGVSARTLFRYFPTKEDYLLALPRRGVDATVQALAVLEPNDEPLVTAWRMVRDGFLLTMVDVDLLNLWRRAAADVPEVVAGVRGERTQKLLDATADYCARSFGVDRADDIRCLLLGGVLAGIELAIVEAWGRSDMPLAEIVEEADRSIRELDLL